ncbi:TonB-dependent receptor [Phenylobacterium sp. LjRoot219]|uniref:TonB-dependent receptor n=1 Tax=Phenylobacterium sp. LjRoot219 TaxID=3342283 RepID=UPI003ECDDF0F
MFCKTGLLISAAMAAALAGGAAANAQPVDEAAAQVGEVIVTAQRRSERLQDVPMAVTALSEQALSQAGISQTADLARVTPGLVLPYYGGGIQPALRGVSSQGGNVGDASNVAIYLDGVYQPNPLGNIFDLADAQQIEVLKGPQGTLYGQNATGGAIIITTKRPSFDWEGTLKASYGNFDDVLANGYVSGPIIDDKLAFSLSGQYEDRDGFRRHVITDERDKGLRSKLVRGKLLFTPDENVELTLTGYLARRGDASPYAGQTYNGNSVTRAFFPNFPRASSKQYEADPVVDTIMKADGTSLSSLIHTELGELSTITSYGRTKYQFLADPDYSPVQYALTAGEQNQPSVMKTITFIQEVNFASREIGRTTVTAGLFYLDGYSSLVPSAINLRVPTLPPAAPGATVFQAGQNLRVDKEIWAGYVEVAYRITDDLHLTAGGRYSSEHARGFMDNGLVTVGNGVLVLREEETFNKFVPRVTLRYALTSRDNLYASISQGFKSGVVQMNAPPAKPEILTAYEIGYKGRPLDRLQLNVSAYHYDYKDLQVFRYEPPNSLLENAAKARIRGIDFDATVLVTEGLTVTAGGSFLDGKYKSFPDAAVFVSLPSGGNQTVSQDLSGERMSRAPKFTGTLAANYEHPTSIGDFGAYAGFYYNSGYKLELAGKIPQKKYTTLDAELSFAPTAAEGLRLVAWGRNLTDQKYIASALPSSLADGIALAAPRTYGVRAEYRF